MTEMVPTHINGKWNLLLPDFRAERVEWSDPGWEVERLDSMRANIHAEDVVYDVGTEEGDLSGLYALWGAQLVLVEPNPAVWPCSKAVWEANHFRQPLAFFQGFVDGNDSFGPDLNLHSWPECADSMPMVRAHGFSSLAEHRNMEAAGGEQKIQRMRLDTLVGLVGTPPDAITIDVEGAEMVVLDSAIQTLDRHRPLVWVSVHADMLTYDYDSMSEKVHLWMNERGYRMHCLGSDHEVHWLYWPRERDDVVLP